jgi:N-acetylneuraminate synthase
MKDIQIGDRSIGETQAPLIIAEMSGNHNQSLDRALKLVDLAADAGAHALKLQTYTADTITMESRNDNFLIKDDGSPWRGEYLHDLYQKAHTPWDWHEAIFKRAADHGMLAFSSPFDESAVDFLESLKVPAYKIASFENNHLPLLRKVAATGKPVIVSTGVSSLAEIAVAVAELRDAGCSSPIALKCTSTYPASPENTNLNTLPNMRGALGCHVGLSDHTMGIGTSVAAVALGACVIEKHFTVSRAEGGVDASFSLEPAELKLLVEECERAFLSLGEVSYGAGEQESQSRLHKRSIYVQKDILPGEVFSEDNLKIVRPGDGLNTRYWDVIIGKKARIAIARGTPLSWDQLL